jgi:hypothetical protein
MSLLVARPTQDQARPECWAAWRSSGVDVGLSELTKVMGLFTLAIGVEYILGRFTTVYRELSLAAPMG